MKSNGSHQQIPANGDLTVPPATNQPGLSALASFGPAIRVRIIVPSRDRNGRAIDFRGLLRDVEQQLLAIAGGTTTTFGRGNWIGSSGQTIAESNAIVELSLPLGALVINIRRLLRCLAWIARKGNQEAVAIGIEPWFGIIPDTALIAWDREAPRLANGRGSSTPPSPNGTDADAREVRS